MMGFFIRKAFKKEPLLINLSEYKEIDSTEVTNNKFGLNRNGAYAYGEWFGLYYREQHGSTNTNNHRYSGAAPIFKNTGTTFPTVYDLIEQHPYPELKEISGSHKNVWLWIVLILSFAIPLYFMEIPYLWGVPGFFTLILLFGYLKDRRWRKKGRQMIDSMATLFDEDPKSFNVDEMKRFINKAPDIYINRFLPDLFIVLLQIALEKQDDPHLFAYNKFEKQIPLTEEFIDQTKKAILTRYFDSILQDHLFNREDESRIRNLIEKLHFDDEYKFEELQFLDLATKIREEMESTLTESSVSIPLDHGEVCYGEYTDIRILDENSGTTSRKEKNLPVSYKIQLEGTLTITNRRIVISGKNALQEFRINQLVDVITDLETNIIELSFVNRDTPVFITGSKPLVISARIKKVYLEQQVEQDVE